MRRTIRDANFRNLALPDELHIPFNVFALAIRKGLTAEDLKTTVFAYPTGASDISYML